MSTRPNIDYERLETERRAMAKRQDEAAVELARLVLPDIVAVTSTLADVRDQVAIVVQPPPWRDDEPGAQSGLMGYCVDRLRQICGDCHRIASILDEWDAET